MMATKIPHTLLTFLLEARFTHSFEFVRLSATRYRIAGHDYEVSE